MTDLLVRVAWQDRRSLGKYAAEPWRSRHAPRLRESSTHGSPRLSKRLPSQSRSGPRDPARPRAQGRRSGRRRRSSSSSGSGSGSGDMRREERARGVRPAAALLGCAGHESLVGIVNPYGHIRPRTRSNVAGAQLLIEASHESRRRAAAALTGDTWCIEPHITTK